MNVERLRGVALKRTSRGAVWQHPLFKAVAPAVDAADAAVRAARGLSHLPKFSMRSRAMGPTHQFGGLHFVASGRATAAQIRDMTGLRPDEDVLEIGCSVGRIALALAEYLQPGRYTGTDIDRRAIAACLTNPKLESFRFEAQDVFSLVYNPGGRAQGRDYVFPFPDASFDVVFLTSVFTHMLPDDIAQYAREIRRMLRPGGRLLCSVLAEEGRDLAALPVARDGYRLRSAEFPENAVAYPLAEIDRLMAGAGMDRSDGGGAAAWAPPADDHLRSLMEQDLLLYVPRR
ncbi:class I SAM-dependent methyltransferase [Acidiferrimicrobium sp. IK]|uniref:class I SAM-dependent methyltransferase n=1 Tax=Acidiferrimicrobium sp. IK TaxID=2871700 RepID=UPI0021CAF196|nr:class I SAM-dependent methyltransferase [Acidiferrimicrobium sp. IK]MCU4185006.1 class I SAM-dependent methyltransferase [Acidiferrimicrobium sp. IK]